MSKTLVNNNNKKDVMIVTGAEQISLATASYYPARCSLRSKVNSH